MYVVVALVSLVCTLPVQAETATKECRVQGEICNESEAGDTLAMIQQKGQQRRPRRDRNVDVEGATMRTTATTTENPYCSEVFQDKACEVSDSIKQVNGITATECCGLCVADSACKAYSLSYNTAKNSHLCSLKSVCGNLTYQAGVITGTTFADPDDQSAGVHIKKLTIDITNQNGVTVDMGANFHVSNDMANSLHHNNNAKSANGTVKRLNGDFDNNAFTKDGDVTLFTDPERAAGDGSSENVSVHGSLDVAVSGELLEYMAKHNGSLKGLLSNSSNGSNHELNSIKRKIMLKEIEKQANHEDPAYALQKMQEGTEKLLEKTLQQQLKNLNSLDSQIPDKRLLNISIQKLMADLKDGSHNTIVHPTNLSDVQEFLKELGEGKAGPTVIDDLQVHVRNQDGVQVDLPLGIEVENNMRGTMHHNNLAESDHGDVWRVNGVMSKNGVSESGNVKVMQKGEKDTSES